MGRLERLRCTVVEGPIGAGKKSLARKLPRRLGREVLLERPDANPFLPLLRGLEAPSQAPALTS